MGANIPGHYVKQYATNIQLLLQQQGSRLRGKVMEGTHKGEQASPVDQLGSVEMQPVTTRFAPMGRIDPDTDRRWIFPLSYDLPQLIDKFDLLKTLQDPKSIYAKNAANAAGRRIDRTIVASFFSSAKTGKEGGTSTAFPSGQTVAVDFGAAAPVGMTVAKLREARRLLKAADVDIDTDPIYMLLDAGAEDNLLAEAQVVSTDFNDRPVLVDGRLRRFLGFEFIHSELAIETLSGGYKQIPAWAKSGMYLGMWEDWRTDVSERNDLQGIPWQIYVWMTIGATRIEEKKVVRILCA